MRGEQRTRSELVREALRFYPSARMVPVESPTPSETRAYRRGDYVSLAEYRDGMDRRPRRAGKKGA